MFGNALIRPWVPCSLQHLGLRGAGSLMDAPLVTVREHNLEVMTEAGRRRRCQWSDGQKAAREGSEACQKGHVSFCTRLALCTYRPSPQLPPVNFFCISSLT